MKEKQMTLARVHNRDTVPLSYALQLKMNEYKIIYIQKL